MTRHVAITVLWLSREKIESDFTTVTSPAVRILTKVFPDTGFSGPHGRAADMTRDEHARSWTISSLVPAGLVVWSLSAPHWTEGEHWFERLPGEDVGGERFDVFAVVNRGRAARARVYLDKAERPRFLVVEVAGKVTRAWFGDYREVGGVARPHELAVVTENDRYVARLRSYEIQ